eukprot:10820-Heterococcus_DN1.PRE.4
MLVRATTVAGSIVLLVPQPAGRARHLSPTCRLLYHLNEVTTTCVWVACDTYSVCACSVQSKTLIPLERGVEATFQQHHPHHLGRRAAAATATTTTTTEYT